MTWLKEFKTFAMRGSVVDLAVGIIIGAGFGKIVNSLVNDIIMPPIGYLLGGIDFSDLAITLRSESASQTSVMIKYGAFINTVVDFTIVAAVIFTGIKCINKLYQSPVEDSQMRHCSECLMSIPLKAKKCGHCQTLF